MIWECDNCGEKFPIARDEFPVHCSCGQVDQGAEFQSIGLGDTVAKITRRFGIKSCGGCGRRQRGLNKLFPYKRKLSARRCDVLNCYPPIDNPEWIKIRGDVYAAELRAAGLDAHSVQVDAKTVEAAAEEIYRFNPRVFCNHAFFFGWEIIAELAVKFPKTNFLTINHSSQADLLRTRTWLESQSHFVELSQQLENVYYGCVDDRNFLSRCELVRCVYVPNLVRWPRWPATHQIKTPRPVASVVGRYDPNKAIPHSILAAAMSKRIDLLFILKQPRRDQLEAFCDSVGVAHEFSPWTNWDTYTKTLFEKVTVGLQPSFTESFNYVAVEHMALGIPVIGSPTVKYLPPNWQANPDDPAAIAARVNWVLDNYLNESKQAVKLAALVQRTNRRLAVGLYRNLSNRKEI